MKSNLLKLFLLVIFSLIGNTVLAQLANVTYSAKIASITSTCQGSAGCSEFGSDPEFTAFVGFKDNINPFWIEAPCLQCDASSSSCTYAQNITFVQNRENTSDVLFGHIEAWEDDAYDRCGYTEYVYTFAVTLPYDEGHMDEGYSYNFRQWDFPTSSSVFNQGPTWGYSNLHNFALSCSWRYSGTENLITPTCTAQTANYTAGGVKSWSLALTAGLTYSFSNCTSGDNATRLKLYGSDGYSVLESNASACSELVFTPTTTGTYYLEIFQVVNNIRSELTQPGVLTYSTDAPFAPSAIAQTFCGPTTANSLVPAISSTIKWYASPTSTTALATTSALATGTYYVVSVGGNNCESVRTPVNVTVNPIPSAPIASTQSFCSLPYPTVANLTATGTNIKWYLMPTGGGAQTAVSAIIPGTYYVSQTVNGCESARTPVSVIVNSTSAPTAASVQSFCASTNPTIANLTATGSNIKWYSAATGGSALATTTAISTGSYYVSQTISGCESTRTTVFVSVRTNNPPTVSAQSFCSVSNPTIASLIAYGIDIKWYSAATGGTALASTTAISTGTYYVSQFDNGCESVRTPVSVTVTATPSAPIASAQSICSVANPTIANLTATGTAIKWYYDSINGSPLATTTAISSGLYYVSQTVNGCESARTMVNVTVSTAPAAPTASDQLFCSTSNPKVSNLVATGTAIKWYSVATGGTSLATTAAISTGTYYVSQTTNGCESTRTAVSVTVGSTISPPTASAQSFCTSSNPTVANLTATGTSIKWYSAATGGTALATTTPISTGTYYVSQTNGCESTRLSVSVTVVATLPAPTAYTQSYCSATNPTVASLVTVTGSGIKWYSVATGGTALATTTPISTGTYYASQSSSGCESTRTAVSVTVGTSPSAPTASAQSFCSVNNPTIGHLAATGTGTTLWYLTATGGTSLSISSPISTGTYYAAKYANGCESARIAVSVTVTATPSAPTASDQSFCSGSNPTVANLTPSGTGIQWNTSSSLVTGIPLASTTPISTGTYYVSQTINGCESPRTTVNVTINTSPSLPVAASTINYTVGDTATALTATTGGNGLLWYATATGGSFTTTAPTPSTTTVGSTSYWVSSINTTIGCESARVEIVVKVNNRITNAPTTNLTTQVYTGNDKNLSTLQVTGSTIKWYNAATGGTLLPSTTLLVDETTYYASQTVVDVESTNRLAITVNKISENTQTLLGNSTINNLVATPSTGSASQWFTTASGGAALAGTTTLTNGNYYVEQTSPTVVTTLGSGFSNSFGVAIQPDGKILVSETLNNAIKRMNADGTGIVTLATGFNRPMGIAIQTDGKIVVADFNNNAIKRMNSDGTGIVTLGSGFNTPRGVAIQADGKILLADRGNNAIKRMNADGTGVVTLFSGLRPEGVAVQPDGKIVVADTGNNAIKRMDSDGSNVVTLASGLNEPYKAAIQADGKIVFAEGLSNTIKRMNADGTGIVTLATGFNIPSDVAIQTDGKIVVADYGNALIKRISLSATSNRVPVTVQLDVPTITSTQTNVLCNGSAAGAINISTTGGTSPYTYNWGGGITTKDRTGLTAGTYSVIVTDANGISVTKSIIITQPNTLTSSISSQTNVTCNGGSNGSATVSAVGGASGYTYSWSPSGGTAATITGRTAGTYTCTITDANGCTKTQSVTITQPNALSSSITSQTDVSCNGGSDGSATISASGGASGYTYSWSPSGGTSATITGRTAGVYTCAITDAIGCTKIQSVTINQPATINNAVSLSNGVLIAGLTGATYQWYECPNTLLSGETNQSYTPTVVGDYKVDVTVSGCAVTSSCVTVSTLGNTDFEFKNKFKIYPNPATNDVTIQFSDLNETKLEVVDITGKLLLKQNLNSNENKVDMSQLPSGLYLFKVSSNEGTATQKVVKQ